MAKEGALVLRRKSNLSGQGWAACQQMSQLLFCLSPHYCTALSTQAPPPHPATESPDGLNNFTLLFLWGDEVGSPIFTALSGVYPFLFWLLAFCSVNICLREEESAFTFEAKEEVTYEMRADPLSQDLNFPDILKLLTLTPAVCCP